VDGVRQQFVLASAEEGGLFRAFIACAGCKAELRAEGKAWWIDHDAHCREIDRVCSDQFEERLAPPD
jgi:hypothetical protein